MKPTGILTKKFGMSRIIASNGLLIPVTMLIATENIVEHVKTKDKDGYTAIVVGFEQLKHPRKTRRFRFSRELPLPEDSVNKGDKILAGDVPEGSLVTLIGESKGHGYQGVVKRWGFSGGLETHGSTHHREPGSIGQRAKPGEVRRGSKMPGHMGNTQVTLKHREIIKVLPDKNIIFVKGAVPGARDSLVILKIEK